MQLHQREPRDPNLLATAHRVLDDAKAGLNIAEYRITWALKITGDLTDDSQNQLANIAEQAHD